MDKRVALLPKKREAFVAIRRFMMDGDVTLREEEEKILNRWIYVDALLKSKEHNEDGMIKNIMDNYAVSVYTARNDIQYTQRLFGDSRKINKKYLIHLHLDRIDRDIQILRTRLFEVTTDKEGKTHQCIPDAKEMAALAKLHETYTYTLNSIPDDILEDKQPPPIFQFILAPGQVIERPMLVEDALRKADEILKLNDDGVYETE